MKKSKQEFRLPLHRKVKYMLDDPSLALHLLDHWAGGKTRTFTVKDVKRFQKDVTSSDLTMGDWLEIKWEGME